MPIRSLALVAALACASGAAAWSPAVAIRPLTTARIEELTAQPAATRADCLAAVAAVALGKRMPSNARALVHELEKREIVKARDLHDLGRPATRGYACLLFKRALDEPGGVLGRVFVDSEHYAYQHLQFLGLIPAGSSWVSITGPELVSLVSLSKKYQRGGLK